jgi:hypothetical protein
MPSDRKPGPILSIAVILAVLLLLAYVGTYYATVKPTPAGVVSDGLIRIDSIVPQYRISNNGWRRFFSPMHSIDRRIRPSVWTT